MCLGEKCWAKYVKDEKFLGEMKKRQFFTRRRFYLQWPPTSEVNFMVLFIVKSRAATFNGRLLYPFYYTIFTSEEIFWIRDPL